MELHDTGQVPFLQYRKLKETAFICHGFSTRMGGVSSGIYSTMNFKEDGEDTSENIRENYRRMAQALGCDVNKMVRSQLCHGVRVHEVVPKDFGVGVLARSTLLDYDGLITDIPGVTLVATFADCVPLYFVDTVHHAIGLAHSGWRGTVDRIAWKMLAEMKRAYQTKPQDVQIAVGPCICGDCYEVGEDLREAFVELFSGQIEVETGVAFSDICRPGREPGKYFLDLRLANLQSFLKAGVSREQIIISDICTCCNPELIFSHRFTKGKRGVSAAFLGIKEEKEQAITKKIHNTR